MPATKYPTTVDLKNLPEDGESFEFSRQSGELNQALKDLVPQADYTIDLTVKPMGNVFEIGGNIDTELELTCSRCGRDMKFPVQDKFQELIVVTKEKPRAGHSGHTGGDLSEGPYCNYLTHYSLDLGEFVHEHIASAEPYAPHCNRLDCESFLQRAQGEISADKDEPTSPFAALKNLSIRRD
jgi:uncharacterized protein